MNRTNDRREGSIRVAMLIQGYFPQIGGAERQLTALAPALQSRGTVVDVITRRVPGLPAFEMINGVAVHRVATRGTRATSSAAFTIGALQRVVRLRPQLIHAHDVFSPATAALLAKRLLGIPVIVKVPRGGRLGNVERLTGRALGRQRMAWLRRRVDAFVVISREIDHELAAIGVRPDRRVAIPNGVDTTHFTPHAEDEELLQRARLIRAPAPVVIFTGRLAPEKRLDDLLVAWRTVRARHERALLLLVGAGDQRVVLEESAGEGVRFVGSVLDVAPYLRAADVFVLPSAAEGLSNSLLEAMSTGLPCVATAVGGALDLIDHGRNGWLVPPGDPDALGQAILDLLGDVECRRRMGQQARQHIEARYSLPAITTQMLSLYHRLVPRGSLSSIDSVSATGV